MPKRVGKQTGAGEVIAVLSDTHAGHRAGLLNPDTVLYDEDERGNLTPYKPSLTAVQRYLWQLYIENIERTVQAAAGRPIVVIHNGDITQGNKRAEQLVSTRMSDQISIAVMNLKPWLMLPNVRAVRVVAGTQSHEFLEGSAAALVTERLRASWPNTDVGMLYHGLLTVQGVTIDYSHHGPQTGSRAWLRGNTARFYLRDMMMRALMAGEAPPHLVFRGHYHSYCKEVLRQGKHESTLIVTPSYCAIGDYGRQATQSAYVVENGHVAVEVCEGRVGTIHELIQAVDIRTRESI